MGSQWGHHREGGSAARVASLPRPRGPKSERRGPAGKPWGNELTFFQKKRERQRAAAKKGQTPVAPGGRSGGPGERGKKAGGTASPRGPGARDRGRPRGPWGLGRAANPRGATRRGGEAAEGGQGPLLKGGSGGQPRGQRREKL